MRVRIILILGLIFLGPIVVYARGVSGTDDRKEPFEVSDPRMREAARSVAAMMPVDRIKIDGDMAILNSTPFVDARYIAFDSDDPDRGERFPLDQRTPYYGQPRAAQCAAAMIGPDTLLTAGHCILQDGENVCSRVAFVFNFAFSDQASDPTKLSAKDVYRCDKVLDAAYQDKAFHAGKILEKKISFLVDYAIIKLDRRVEGRVPLTISASPPREYSSVYTIGYPDGLPQKITDSGVATLTSTSDDVVFRTTLDIFHGNSGGPIIDAETGQIVGVVTMGLCRDYNLNKENCSLELNIESDEDRPRNLPVRASYIIENFQSRLRPEAIDFDAAQRSLKP